MSKKIRKKIKSEFFSNELLKMIDDEKPQFSMMLLAFAVVENCGKGKYMFRTTKMEDRWLTHGVLPKSFFRESFLRCTKLMELLKINKLTIDELLEKVINSGKFETVELFERKENKTFYKFLEGKENVNK